MSNMSYCRFQNTLLDLRDCLDALQSGEKVSAEELRAAKRLIEVAGEVSNCDAPRLEPEEDEDDEE